jgi:hypothetical protein
MIARFPGRSACAAPLAVQTHLAPRGLLLTLTVVDAVGAVLVFAGLAVSVYGHRVRVWVRGWR